MKLAVVGPGLIGTSVALASRRAWPDVRLIEIDRGQSLEGAHGAEIVVLATPVDVIIDIVTQHARYFGDAVILDTGSTKRAIVAAAREAGLANFVGGHPMAGAASSGARDARPDLFDGKPWFLVPHGASAQALARAQTFVESLGATAVVFQDDGTEHDRVMAAVSHLPQVVASALMAVVGEAAGETGLRWAGGGLHDTTRLAASPASMWESVLATNTTELQPLLTRLSDDLETLAGRLHDRDAIRRLFETASHYRQFVK